MSRKPRITVIGDVMLDRYWFGLTNRISPEAPVPIIHIQDQKNCVGGAGNVALNIAAQGAECHLIAVIGEDEPGQKIEELCHQANIVTHFVKISDHPTTLKLRAMSRSQQLMRMDFEKKYPLDFETIKIQLDSIIDKTDVLVLSDYAKGVLAEVSCIIDYAKSHGVPVLVDPKQKQFQVYRGATILTPNTSEFEDAVGCAWVDDTVMQAKALEMLEKLKVDSMIITRGEKGVTVVNAQHQFSVPTVAKEVFDVTGAGDTVVATLAVELAKGRTLTDAVHTANRAAAIAVSKLGTTVVSEQELNATHQMTFRQRIVDEAILLEQVHLAKQRGQRVVMTNGCFDILHPGHVQYLHQAKALGDILIVAVNTDESVKQLKGPTRPIHPLWHRMEVLAGLSCVDWVIPFSEETPQRLIEKFVPHVLVKGGDYQAHTVVGGEVVKQHGGQVVILPLVPDCATTQSIAKIRQYEEV
jgi:D-beta-D-heptose 7-phosphate kinase/D-beta-D-heptose 1-phosphate adenosyltransferase